MQSANRICGRFGPRLALKEGSVRQAATLLSSSSPVAPSDLRSYVKVEVDVLGSPFLTVLMVSMDAKQH